MAINAGYKAKIAVSSTPVTTYAQAQGAIPIKNMKSFDNSVEKKDIETTSFGSQFETFLGGIKSGSFSMSGVLNGTDPGQKILIDNFDGVTDSVSLVVWENETDTKCTVFNVFVSKVGKKAEATGSQDVDFEFKLTESPVKLSQA